MVPVLFWTVYPNLRRSFGAPDHRAQTVVAAAPQYHKYLKEENRFHSSTRHSDSRPGGGRVPPPRNRNLDYPTYNFTGARSHNYSTFDLLKTPIKESRFWRQPFGVGLKVAKYGRGSLTVRPCTPKNAFRDPRR